MHVDLAVLAGLTRCRRWTGLWTDRWKSLRPAVERSGESGEWLSRAARKLLHSLTAESSEAIRAEVRRQACRTVVWSRPPNSRPMAGSEARRELAREVHRELAWPGDAWTCARVETSSSAGDAEVLARRRSGSRAIVRARRPAVRIRDRGCRGPPWRARRSSGRPVSELKATTRIRAPSSARTLVVDVLGDTSEHDGRRRSRRGHACALAQDRHSGGEVGGLDVGHEPGLEALAQPILQGLEVVGWAVGGRARPGVPRRAGR